MIIACDIDGVLADPKEFIQEYLAGDKEDWEEYFKHTEEIPPTKVCRLITSIVKGGKGVTFCFVTSRPESNKPATQAWLRANGLPGTPIWMRADGDTRSSSEYKMEIYKVLEPDIIIEDEPELVEKLIKYGKIVLQVHGYRSESRPTDRIPR